MNNNKLVFEILDKSRLTLRTNEIYYNSTFTDFAYDINNTIGQVSQYGQLITFKNINFQEVMGDLYNKYDKFIMVLTATNERYTPGTLSAVDVNFSVWVKFDNNIIDKGAYDLKTQMNKQYTAFTADRMPYYSGVFSYPSNSHYYNSRRIIINKPPKYTDLTIELKNSSNATTEKQTSGIIGHTTFIFDYYGLKIMPIYKHLNNNSYFSMDYKHIKNNLLN